MKEYYTLEAQSVDWVYVITRMLARYKTEPMDVVITLEDGNPVYHIRKSLVPAEELAKVLRTKPEAVLAATQRIKLHPFNTSAWQTPTVPYYGEA